MTVLLEQPWIGFLEMPAVGGEGVAPTLETAVLGVWEALAAHRVTDCPVCGGHMAPRYGAAGRPLGGRCSDCGSTLS